MNINPKSTKADLREAYEQLKHQHFMGKRKIQDLEAQVELLTKLLDDAKKPAPIISTPTTTKHYEKPAPDPTKHVGYVKTVNKTNEGMQEQAQERYDQERAKIQHNSTISHKQLWYLSYLMGCRDTQGHNFKFASYPKLDKDTLDRAVQFYQHYDKGFRQLNNEDIKAHIKAAGYPNVPESYTRAIKDINFKDRCEMYTKLCRYYKLDTETGIMTNVTSTKA